jgi:hypothetical protein
MFMDYLMNMWVQLQFIDNLFKYHILAKKNE